MTSQILAWSVSLLIWISPYGFQVLSANSSMSALKRHHLRLSSILSHNLTTLLGYPGLVVCDNFQGQMCVDHRKRWVLCLYSLDFSLFLPGRQGFVLHAVTRLLRPCFISTVYGSATLCPSPLRGLLGRQGFMAPSTASGVRPVALPWVRRTASPDAVQLHAKEISPDIWSRSYMPARPSPHRHIAGLLFATYLVLPHTSSRHPISGNALVLLVWCFRPVTAHVLLPDNVRKAGKYAMPGAHQQLPAKQVVWGWRPRRGLTVLLKPPDFGKDLKAEPLTVPAPKGGGFSSSNEKPG